MADIEKLEALYKKEVKLYQQHKERAEDLKKQIDEVKGQAIIRSVKNLRLSPEEFKKLQKALEDESNVKKLIGGYQITNETETRNEV